jgi:hypothetical protein
VKNNLIVDIEERRVRYLSHTYAGRVHDKRICDEEIIRFRRAVSSLKIRASKDLNLKTSRPINRKKSPATMNSVLQRKPRIR